MPGPTKLYYKSDLFALYRTDFVLLLLYEFPWLIPFLDTLSDCSRTP